MINSDMEISISPLIGKLSPLSKMAENQPSVSSPIYKLDRAVDGTSSQIPTLLAEIALVPHSIVLSNQAKFYLYVILLIIPFSLICHMTML